jgi:hypothetical protein
MYLVLCDSDDIPALWAWKELRQRMGAIELVTSEALAYAVRWEHRVDSTRTSTTITLGDGRVIRSEEVQGTINRLHFLPCAHLRAVAADRDYAAAELFAFFASWLHALPKPVLNPASPSGLSGAAQWREYPEWLLLAAKSGLDVPTYVENETTDAERVATALAQRRLDTRTLIVIGNAIVGATPPDRVAAGCAALARRADLAILGVDFDENWVFRSATVLPDFRVGSQAAIEALMTALSSREGHG